ncbi:hypothetical protein [Pseudomonas paeninsulae]|nr:hypothetical protein [Pseudomonas sp. IT1137]
MTRQQRAHRRAIAITAIAFAILTTVIMILPAIGGMITAEQPISSQR